MIVHALNMAYYLLGRNSQIEMNHENLKFLTTQPILGGRQCKWVEFLQQILFEINKVKGKENVVTNVLSGRKWENAKPMV